LKILALTLFGGMILGALGACIDHTGATCQPACGLGEVCDQRTRECVAAPIQKFEGDLPGRSAGVVKLDGRVFFAGISEGNIIAGQIRRDGHDTVKLATVGRIQRVRIAAYGERVVVVWPGQDNRFALATRARSSENWTFEEVSGTYTAGANFDVKVWAGEVHIVFQDADRSLKHLWKAPADQSWTLELVDDGGPADNGISCPDSLRRTRTPGGVGVAPSLLLGAQSVAVAYQDDDCGDLRLARKTAETWTVDVVDVGSSDGRGARGRIGAHIHMNQAQNGQIGIAYHDEGLAALKYASPVDRGFAIGVVDSGTSIDALARESKTVVGLFPSLVFTSRNEPRIAYMDGTQGRVRLAGRALEALDWSNAIALSQSPVGWWTSHIISDDVSLIFSARFVPSGEGLRMRLEAQWE